MEIEIKYGSLKERKLKIAENEAKGLRMLHDNFDPDWKRGDEPHGVMIFTDEPAPVAPVETPRDPLAEIDELKAELKEKGIIDAL